MRILPLIFFLFCFGCAISSSSDNSNKLPNEYCGDLTNSELQILEKLVQADIKNWPKNIPDTLSDVLWKVFPLFDCKHEIVVKTDSGKYKLDLISEIRRRTFGGFAGSYPHAESWALNIEENELIKRVKSIIENDSTLQIANYIFPIAKDSYWLKVSVRRPKSDEIINFWIRGSSIALVSYSSESFNERKLINKDFWFVENNERIQEFESLIIEKIK